MPVVWVGVDVGGTFTDAVAYDEAGALRRARASSTPTDPAQGVLAVLAKLGVALGDVERVVHGTTSGTDAILKGKRVLEVDERVAFDGTVLRPLDPAAVRAVLGGLVPGETAALLTMPPLPGGLAR